MSKTETPIPTMSNRFDEVFGSIDNSAFFQSRHARIGEDRAHRDSGEPFFPMRGVSHDAIDLFILLSLLRSGGS